MTFPVYATINDLSETTFIAGTEQVYTFNVYNSASAPINIASGSTSWRLSKYGDPTVLVTKTGSPSGSASSQFSVTLEGSDTIDLSGKYLHQPLFIDADGSPFRPSQGILNITSAIQ